MLHKSQQESTIIVVGQNKNDNKHEESLWI